MKPWKAIFAALVIFCAGVGAGALAAKLYSQSPARYSPRPTRPPDFGASQRIKESLVRLDQQLKLTTDQWERIQNVLQESQERMKKIWQGIAPQAQESFKQTKQHIHEILTPEQRKLFDELCRHRGHRRGEEAAGRNQPREWRHGPLPGKTPAVPSPETGPAPVEPAPNPK